MFAHATRNKIDICVVAPGLIEGAFFQHATGVAESSSECRGCGENDREGSSEDDPQSVRHSQQAINDPAHITIA